MPYLNLTGRQPASDCATKNGLGGGWQELCITSFCTYAHAPACAL